MFYAEGYTSLHPVAVGHVQFLVGVDKELNLIGIYKQVFTTLFQVEIFCLNILWVVSLETVREERGREWWVDLNRSVIQVIDPARG